MKFNWLNKNIVCFGAASFFNDFCHEMSTAILPALVNELVGSSFAPELLGFIEGIADASSTVMKLVSGWLADKLNYYKPILLIGYGITPFFVALLGTAYSITSLIMYRATTWMSRGLREPVRDTWLSKIVSSKYYGRAFGFQRAMDTLGAIVGPLCAFILFKLSFSIRTIFLIAFIPGILSLVAIIFTKEKNEQNSAGKKGLYIEHIRKLPKKFVYFVIIMFIFGIGNFHHILLINRVQELFGNNHSFLIATSSAVLLYTIFNIIRAISEFGIGMLSDFINRKYLLAIVGFGSFAVTALCFTLETLNILIWFLFFALAGLSAGTVKTLEKAYAAELLPVDVRGSGFGILQTFDGIGDLISSSLVGFLWTTFSVTFGLLYAAIMSFIAMVLLMFFK